MNKRTSMARAAAWRDKNAANYSAYQWFLSRARNYARDGEQFSIKYLVEEYRWLVRSDADKQGLFKFDNSLASPLLRLLIHDAPEIEPYVRQRSAACDLEAYPCEW